MHEDHNLLDWKMKLNLALMALSGLTLIVWGILKAIGVINTPGWIKMMPVVSAGVGILTIMITALMGCISLGKIIQKVNDNCKKLKSLSSIEKRLCVVEYICKKT